MCQLKQNLIDCVFKVAIFLEVALHQCTTGLRGKIPDTPKKLIARLSYHRIIPDVVDHVSANASVLQVVYNNITHVTLGNRLTPIEALFEPTNITWKTENQNLYTLAMIGPDVPTKEQPSAAEFRHWLVVNIPGNDWTKGEILDDYLGIGFDYRTGVHRFVLLLFKQPSNKRMYFSEGDHRYRHINLKRIDFSIKYFAGKYNLGHALAINFFKIKYELDLKEFLP